MMKAKYFSVALFLGVLAFGISACTQTGAFTPQAQASINQAVSYGLITSQIANALVNAKEQVAAAEASIASHKSDFTDAQWAQLTFAGKQINQAVTLIDNLSKGPGGSGTAVLVNMAELTQIYGTTKTAYLTAKSIVQPDLMKFTPQQQADLNALDMSAQALDQGAVALAHAAPGTNITPLLISALQVAALAAKVALAAGA